MTINDLNKKIKDVVDFPKKGIIFKDITPLLQDPKSYQFVIDKFSEFAKEIGANVVCGPESRGFIFGCPVAIKNGLSFVPIRKPGKLPRETVEIKYDLEYGSNVLQMHKDAIKKGDKVLVVDDLLATGGTINATIDLVESLGAEVVGLCFVIELEFLGAKDKYFKGRKLLSLLKY